ncbi:hypothetical protein K505DRAFT_246244 [Melanomma pulvis-pyrius CBS 109.77]|uniref:Rhodopsin domain-containing protein n=1 Tax=Melanomma pulvis-pyrius CBS 109.77 TaxID=1314802 RepID=A0A6A6X8D2_9PLEO|nr:hypothetical protein K505DRAFT_246244 [Melanomma pulvis-pyrius CBS 109.77]
MATTQQFPDRKYETISLALVTIVLTTFIASWRLVVRYRINPRLGWSDYWIMVALPLSISGHIFNILASYAGEGRLDADPFLTRAHVVDAKKLSFFAGALNMYAMFAAKLSICAYLLALNFSRSYRVIIIISTVFVVVNLLILPLISHWLNCNPVAKRWDNRLPGECWSPSFPVIVTSMQGAVNVLTDLIYAAAPILYLRRVKMTRYTRWGVRAVFLCALLGTAVSIAKVVAFARVLLRPSKNGLYHATTISVLSLSENSIAIIVACLPPLRRTFDNLLMKILPERLRGSIGGSQPPSRNFALPSYYSNKSIHGNTDVHGDAESSTAILPEDEYIEDANGRIIKTTKVTVVRSPSDSTAEFGSDGQDLGREKG